MPITNDQAVAVARRHGLSLTDAASLAAMAGDEGEADRLAAELTAPPTEPDYAQMDATQRRHALNTAFARKGQQARANREQADREQNDRAYQSRMAAGTQTGGNAE